MSARQRYRTAAAFRAALEQRLRAEAQTSVVPLSRLRKEAAFNRLLARLGHVAPDTWALKGGLALIARANRARLRYPVVVKLDGRVFERLSLDVKIVGAQDPRPLEW